MNDRKNTEGRIAGEVEREVGRTGDRDRGRK